jgi:hypothetical protein
MSAAEKARVKDAVASFVADPAQREITPGDLARRVEAATGLSFAPTTIARYLTGHGWTARDRPGVGRVYVRPPREATGAGDYRPPMTPNSAPLPAAPSPPPGTNPPGTGD